MSLNKEYRYSKLRIALWEAISYLATENGDMRERLKKLFIGGALFTVEVSQFPEELKLKWEKIEKYINKYPAKYNFKGEFELGSIEVTLNKIQNRTACKIARLILELYEEMKKFDTLTKDT